MRRRGFTLAEVMVAILFVSIALFGYMSLHMRIIHSATTLQQRHAIRRKVNLQSALLVAKARWGSKDLDHMGSYPLFVTRLTENFLSPYLHPGGDDRSAEYQASLERNVEMAPLPAEHLQVRVSWDNRHGPQEYVVDTLVCPKDKGW